MSTTSVTTRQAKLLQIIEDSLTKRGYVPTLQEMARAMGITSPQGVKWHLAALERKGSVVFHFGSCSLLCITAEFHMVHL
jgi:SOS-response transcriptional repressor LexA